ncbi:hypothetical protein DFH06DRAFT_1383024 [Mycena polygramma]|nr:hypothetical protein DFH06DRAFT_1383024 [Mycena polygramma]
MPNRKVSPSMLPVCTFTCFCPVDPPLWTLFFCWPFRHSPPPPLGLARCYALGLLLFPRQMASPTAVLLFEIPFSTNLVLQAHDNEGARGSFEWQGVMLRCVVSLPVGPLALSECYALWLLSLRLQWHVELSRMTQLPSSLAFAHVPRRRRRTVPPCICTGVVTLVLPSCICRSTSSATYARAPTSHLHRGQATPGMGGENLCETVPLAAAVYRVHTFQRFPTPQSDSSLLVNVYCQVSVLVVDDDAQSI